jgi:hypothetical protein
MSNIKLNDILKDILAESTEEQTYKVTYYITDKYGDDVDYDEIVKATSEEEAIKKVKAKDYKNARAFSAELKK